MRWVLPTMRAFWNILFIRICVGVIEKNKVYKDSYRRLGILRYIFKKIQDDSVRWYPSVTKTSHQISAHFLQYSSLWMNRSAQCELYNSCLYFFKVLLRYIVLRNFFYIFFNECHLKPTERIVFFFADSKMDVLKTSITVFLILIPVIIKAQQNIQGNNY